LRILGRRLFGLRLHDDAVAVRGIDDVGPRDAALAVRLRGVLKPVAAIDAGAASAWVAPAFVPDDHPLAPVAREHNGLLVDTDAGELFLSGPGAGPLPTATALLDDVLTATRAVRMGGGAAAVDAVCDAQGAMAWFIAITVDPGQLDADDVAEYLTRAGIVLRQQSRFCDDDGAVLAAVTARVPELRLQAVVGPLRGIDGVRSVRVFRAIERRTVR
jgi:hypothetical protein